MGNNENQRMTSRPLQVGDRGTAHRGTRSESRDSPVEAPLSTLAEVRDLYWGKATPSVWIGATHYNLARGQIYRDSTGSYRLVIGVSSGQIAFVRNNRVCMQTTEGFQSDVGIGEVATQAYRRNAIVITLIETEFKFLEGVLSALSLPMWAALAGKDIIAFVLENRRNFSKWQQGLEYFLLARSLLKSFAPKLYSILRNHILKELVDVIPESVNVKDVARTLGVLFGSLPKIVLASIRSRLWTFRSVVLLALKTILLRTPQTKWSRVKSDPEKEIIASFAKLGISLVPKDASELIDEYRANNVKIEEAVGILIKAIALLSSN